ncbi:MAG: 30S ribosomal protein S7 [Candidatus Lokiarchaeum sp. GC14_75]|nr:MAG: 30S ribosomal protein S7 [Candidatus Lokiarchaeum sp. GC14_75]
MSKTKKEIKLFNQWSFENIEIRDKTLEYFINLRPIIIPHSAGRHEHRRFWKSSKISVIERFTNRLLAPGFIGSRIRGRKSSYHSGKKAMLLRSLKNAFVLIHLTTGVNPVQILVDAIVICAPREETTKIAMGGISYASAVDIAPQRRVDLALKYLVQAIGMRTHSNEKTFEENLSQELLLAAQNSQDSRAVKRRDEIERIAISAR